MTTNMSRNLSCALCSLFFIVIFTQLCSAVVRPDYFRPSNSRRPPAPAPTEMEEIPAADAPSTSRESQVATAVHDVPQYVTAQHCCKIGEYMARRSSTCRVNQPIRSNTLIKTKRKPRHQSDFSKSLQAQLSACHQHVHLIQKCCFYRRQYVRALELCEDMPTLIERVKCRWEAEEQYGY